MRGQMDANEGRPMAWGRMRTCLPLSLIAGPGPQQALSHARIYERAQQADSSWLASLRPAQRLRAAACDRLCLDQLHDHALTESRRPLPIFTEGEE